MSALRVYAETGTLLLNTGPDVDDDTDTIRRLHKTGVKLHYESEPRRLRCYAQVRRTSTSSPEQVIFEYDPDPGEDVFEAFVRDAEAAVEDASWQLISDSSPAYEALKRGRRDTPDPIRDVAVGFEDLLKQLDEQGKRIDLVATDDGAGTGLARHVHGEFDGRLDVAVAGTGRTASVISDVDVVIVPGGSHTGVPERTVDRFKQIQLDEQTERLEERLDELSDRRGLDGLAAHLKNEVIEPEEGITLRPPSARSWWKPDRSWLLGAVAVGLLAVVVYGGWTNRGRTVELLTRRVAFIVPGWIPGPVRGVIPSGVGLVSWWVVLAGSLAAVVSLAAVFVWKSRVGGSVEIEGSEDAEADDTTEIASQPDGDDDTVETDLNAPLAAIEETVDRETRTERLVDALEGWDIEVVSSDRTRKRYQYGPRLTAAAIALAVTVSLFVLNPIAVGLAVVETGWFLILEGFVALAAVAVGGGVVVAVLAVRKRVVAALATVRTKAKTGLSLGSIRRGGDDGVDIDELEDKVANERWGYFTPPELDDLLEDLENDRDPELAELLLEVDEKPSTYPLWEDEDRELAEEVAAESGSEGAAEEVAAESGSEGAADPRSTDASGGVTDSHQPASTADSPKDASDTEPEQSGDDSPESIDRLGGTESTPETTETTSVDEDDESTAATAVTGLAESTATDRFAQYRYNQANTGHVRNSAEGSDIPPEKLWEFDTTRTPLAPVVTDEGVYVVDEGGNVYAIDHDGEKRWKSTVDDDVQSAPALSDGRLYFGSEGGTVYAVGTGGERVWNRTVGTESAGIISRGIDEIRAPPAVGHGQVYVGDTSGQFHALDVRNGVSCWSDEMAPSIKGKPAIQGDTVYVVNQKGLVVAFDPNGDNRSFSVGATVTTTPAVVDGSMYVTDENGVVHRLATTAGGSRAGSYAFGSDNPVAPTVGDERVYLGARTGTVIAVDRSVSDDREWGVELGVRATITNPFVLDESTLYVPAGRKMYALDRETGDERWDYRLKSTVSAQPALVDGQLFVPEDGRITALSLD